MMSYDGGGGGDDGEEEENNYDDDIVEFRLRSTVDNNSTTIIKIHQLNVCECVGVCVGVKIMRRRVLYRIGRNS